MIAYVGLDVGVDASMVTNSFSPNLKLHLRKPLERNLEVDTEHGRDIESIRELPLVLNIQPHEDVGQKV
jgi:hypothetical protein